MKVYTGESDLLDKFEVVVDSDSEPVDLDRTLAGFLLSYVRSTSGASPGDDRNESEANEKR